MNKFQMDWWMFSSALLYDIFILYNMYIDFKNFHWKIVFPYSIPILEIEECGKVTSSAFLSFFCVLIQLFYDLYVWIDSNIKSKKENCFLFRFLSIHNIQTYKSNEKMQSSFSKNYLIFSESRQVHLIVVWMKWF